jgi:peptidoglycan/xylan/chitin deacetylase (PgdA/CDA1 family)
VYVFYLGRRRLGRILFLGLGLLFFLGASFKFGQVKLSPVPVMKVEPIYQGKPDLKAVALVFNVDWGQEYLPQISGTLAAENVKATFFITGRWAQQFPELVKDLGLAGHEMGNHGHSHHHVNDLSPQEHKRDIQQAEKILGELCGQKPCLYAPPYGENKPHVVTAAAELGYQTIMWTVNTGDWMPERSGDAILQIIQRQTQNGAIILLHPTEKTASILPEIIHSLKSGGYSLKRVTEII